MRNTFLPFFFCCGTSYEINKFLKTGTVSQLLADRMRHRPVRVLFIFRPGIRQRQIGCLFGESAGFIDMCCNDFCGPCLGDRNQLCDFFQSLMVISGLEGDFRSSAVDLAAIGEVSVDTSSSDGTYS